MLIYPHIYAILGYYVMVLNDKLKAVSEVKFLESYCFLDKRGRISWSVLCLLPFIYLPYSCPAQERAAATLNFWLKSHVVWVNRWPEGGWYSEDLSEELSQPWLACFCPSWCLRKINPFFWWNYCHRLPASCNQPYTNW